MRVVIEQQRHSLRRELVLLGLVILSGVLTILVLLLPTLAG